VGGMANKYSHVENCETSAIGRALANANLYNKNKPRASASEMKKVETAQRANEEPFPVDEKEETFSTADLKERLNQLSDEQQASAKKWIARDLRGVTTADGRLLNKVTALQLSQLEEVYLKITQ